MVNDSQKLELYHIHAIQLIYHRSNLLNILELRDNFEC